jgi:hypothetical protein
MSYRGAGAGGGHVVSCGVASVSEASADIIVDPQRANLVNVAVVACGGRVYLVCRQVERKCICSTPLLNLYHLPPEIARFVYRHQESALTPRMMEAFISTVMNTFVLPKRLSRGDNVVMTFYTRHDEISGSHGFKCFS